MATLIILNIILIIVLIFLIIYIFKNKKDNVKNICIHNDYDKNENVDYRRNKNINSDRIFVGRFVTDEEYQQMITSRRSNISILLEEVEKEYEKLKSL